MDQRACEQCGETVSAAKAFCPACGHAFVEEAAREETTEFQGLDSTMQVGQTMYNQMLSEMGLNLAPAAKDEKVSTAAAPPAKAAETLRPVSPKPIRAAAVETIAPATAPAAPSKPKDNTKLLLLIGGVIVAGFVLLLLLVGFFAILPRLR
jgi:hypothetical protein